MAGKSTKYSLFWAQGIVDHLCEAHARASEIALHILGFTQLQVAYLLAEGEKEYYLIREAIRKLDRSLGILPWKYSEQTLSILTTRMLSDLVDKSTEYGLESFRKYLTGRNSRPILENPVKRGGPEAYSAEGPVLFDSASDPSGS